MKASEFKKLIREEIRRVIKEVDNEVVLSNEILDFLEERGVISANSAQKIHKDLTDFLKSKIIKEEVRKVIAEGTVMIFYYSKKSSEIDGNVKELQKKAQEYIKAIRDKDYIISSNDSVLYFPNFTWAGGKQVFGPSFGILAGSTTMLVSPIGTSKIMKIAESLLVRFVKDGRIESYNLY